MYDESNWARSEERPITWDGPDPDLNGWIYVAVNILDVSRCKVGRTKRGLYVRATETTNPFYVLHVAYNIQAIDMLPELESWIHSELRRRYWQYRHTISNKPSEWFHCEPYQAQDVIEECLRRHFQCPQDDRGWLLEADPVGLLRFIPHYNLLHLADRMHDDLSVYPYWRYLFPRAF